MAQTPRQIQPLFWCGVYMPSVDTVGCVGRCDCKCNAIDSMFVSVAVTINRA